MTETNYQLNANSWHAKLMKFNWGLEGEEFTNMCPYFWLTILNVFVVLPVAICKIVAYPIDEISEYISKKNKARRLIFYEETYKKLMAKGGRDWFRSIDLRKSSNRKYTKFYYGYLKDKNRNLYDILWDHVYDMRMWGPLINEKRSEEYVPIKTFLLGLVRGIKVFFTILWYIAMGFIVVTLIWVLIKNFGKIDWAYVLYFILYLSGAVGIINLMAKYNSKAKKGFLFIMWPIIQLFKLIGMLYKNNCPGIVWNEELKEETYEQQ